jgi:hypothetical protein
MRILLAIGLIALHSPLAGAEEMLEGAFLMNPFDAAALAPAPAGSEPFTEEEVAAHQVHAPEIIRVADQCLRDTLEDHFKFHAKWKFSRYYGDRNPKYKTAEGRIAAIRAVKEVKYSLAQARELEKQLVGISCIGLTMKCLKQGFEATDTQETWGKIVKKLGKDMLGTDLLSMLQKLGWRLRYWNPDPSRNQAWDAEDRKLNPLQPGKTWMPVWGGHQTHYNNVMKKGRYYTFQVDDRTSLVGFKDQAPAGFSEVPFFVGIAHVGYHVFPGRFGQIIEAHSMRTLDSANNLETSEFNPLAPNGGPRWTKNEKYRSGLIAVPPGF